MRGMRIETTETRVQWILTTPAMGRDLDDLLVQAAKERADEMGVSMSLLPDDAMHVETAEDNIVIWWVKK